LATYFAGRLAEGCPQPVLVLPSLHLGYSPHHLPFAGTLTLESGTFLAVLRDILASLHQTGFRRFALLNGHGGNDELVKVAARDAVQQLGVSVCAVSYWTPALHRLGELKAELGGTYPIPGHAGRFETALMLYCRPDLVKLENVPDGTREPHFVAPHWFVPSYLAQYDGFTDDPRPATAAEGERFAASIVDGLAPVVLRNGEGPT
jgi:creatinine amidohydrolase